MALLQRLVLLALFLVTTNALAASGRLLSEPVTDEVSAYFGLPAAASDGENVLTVWAPSLGSRGGIFATILRPDGTRAGTSPIVLALEPGVFYGSPAAAWNGSEYLVVWSLWYPNERAGIYLARIAPDGTVLERARKIIGGERMTVTVASNGRHSLLIASTTAALLGEDGSIIRTAALARPATRIAPFGAGFLIGYPGPNAYVASIDDQLEVRHVPVGTGPWFDLASNGETGIVVAAHGGRLLDAQIIVSPESSLSPHTLNTRGVVRDVAVIAHGDGYLGFFSTVKSEFEPEEIDAVWAVEIDRSGAFVGAPRTIFAPTQLAQRLGDAVATNAGAFVAISERDNSDGVPSRLIGQFLDRSAPTILSLGPVDQQHAQVTSNGSMYFAAWLESTSRGGEIYAGRIGADGAPLDGRGLLISSGGYAPAVCFDGRDFVVAWQEAGGVRLQRVSPGGVRRFREPLLIPAQNAFGVAISSDGAKTLVVWSGGHLAADTTIEGALIDGTTVKLLGTVSLPAFPDRKPLDRIYDSGAQLSWTGAHWLLVWNSNNVHSPCLDWCAGTGKQAAARIRADGSPLDSHPLLFGESTWNPGGIIVHRLSRTSVASNGTDSLIVWDESSDTIRGTRVSRDGTLIDGPEGFRIDSWGYEPAVAWSGKSYTVAWSREYPHTGSVGLVSVRVVGDLVNEPARVTPPEEGAWVRNPQIAVRSHAVLLLNDELRADSPFLGSNRIVGRFASELVWTGFPPLAPSNVAAISGGAEVVVTWSDESDNEDAFVIEIRNTSGQATTAWAATNSESARVPTGDSYARPASVRVWAYNTAGRSVAAGASVEQAPRRRIRRGP